MRILLVVSSPNKNDGQILLKHGPFDSRLHDKYAVAKLEKCQNALFLSVG